MRYEATIAVYDVMDQVHVGLTVWKSEPGWDVPRLRILQVHGDVPGTGESDAHEWIRDALVAALEMI